MPRIRPRTRATKIRAAKSRSPERASYLAAAGTARLVLGARLVWKLGQVEAVDEVAENSQTLLIDRRRTLFLLVAGLVGVRNDARGVHDLRGDKDRTLDANSQRDGV